MRVSFFYSLVGLAGVCLFAGCETLRETRAVTVASTNAPPAMVVVKTYQPMGQPETEGGTEHVRIGNSWGSKAKELDQQPATSVAASPALPEPRFLPETAPKSQPVGLPRSEKIDVNAAERAIAGREAELLRNKQTPAVLEIKQSDPVTQASPPMAEITINETPKTNVAENRPMPVDRPMPAVSEPAPDREKTAPAKSADIVSGAAENFKSITGQVQQFRKTWRLRYADIGQDDPYGGFVILESDAELNMLQDGQRIRVTGELVPPQSRSQSAIYRVQTLQIFE